VILGNENEKVQVLIQQARLNVLLSSSGGEEKIYLSICPYNCGYVMDNSCTA